MNIFDLIVIFLIIISAYGGYKRGVLKEVYNLIILIITLLGAYFLRDIAFSILTKWIDFKKLIKVDIDQNFYDFMFNMMKPILGFTLAFMIILIICKIILTILIRTGLIPIRSTNFNSIGSIISVLKTLIFCTIIAFVVSFGFLLQKQQYYENSLLLEPLLKINSPLYKTRNKIKDIYDDTMRLVDIINNQGSFTNSKEIVDTLKKIKENDLITDEMIIEASKSISKNKEEILLTKDEVDEFKSNLKKDDNYELLKSLYDEQIISSDLFIKILEANNISGITAKDITTIFE